MKRISYILSVVFLLAACDNAADVIKIDSGFASVKLSSLSTVIPKEGGAKTFFVATNR